MLSLYICALSMKKLVLIFALALIAQGALYSQKDKVWGSWTALSVQYEFVPRWSFYFETQARSHAMYNHFQYYEFKGGINYRINKDFSALVGFGNYGTYDWQNIRGAKTQDELRIWQQFVINQLLSRLKFEHRFRFEQAWINQKFRNRFRYRINLVVPLNSKKVEAKTVYAAAFNEIFITDTPPYFMRNRIFLGMGYQVNDFLTLQAGWINQFNYNFKNKGAKNFFNLTIAFRINHKGNSLERNPAMQD